MDNTELPALSVDPRVGISRSASETDDILFYLPEIGSFIIIFLLFPLIFYGL